MFDICFVFKIVLMTSASFSSLGKWQNNWYDPWLNSHWWYTPLPFLTCLSKPEQEDNLWLTPFLWQHAYDSLFWIFRYHLFEFSNFDLLRHCQCFISILISHTVSCPVWDMNSLSPYHAALRMRSIDIILSS